ncbi:hypothetical protein BKA69DRAFT_1038720 [Paraphysoderma sedebokerense]|nr:hypothetical protein BKA69DRAFT_1038720 [Paraphysoderma sedebokerense]
MTIEHPDKKPLVSTTSASASPNAERPTLKRSRQPSSNSETNSPEKQRQFLSFELNDTSSPLPLSSMTASHSQGNRENGLPTYTEATSPELPPLSKQLEIISNAKNESMTLGDTWYLISTKWLNAFTTYCEKPGKCPPPGPVDNSDLLEGDSSEELRTEPMELMSGMDYEVLPKSAYDNLVQWFGAKTNPIGRTVVSKGTSTWADELTVETYPCRFTILPLSSETFSSIPSTLTSSSSFSASSASPIESSVTLNISRYSTLLQLKEKICSLFDDAQFPNNDDVRVWTLEGIPSGTIDSNHLSSIVIPMKEIERWEAMTIDAAGFASYKYLAIEKRQNGSWMTDFVQNQSSHGFSTISSSSFRSQSANVSPIASPSLSSPSQSQTRSTPLLLLPPPSPAEHELTDSNETQIKTGQFNNSFGTSFSNAYSTPQRTPGLTGLNNLGNTCFMNSALQCLSNTAVLTLDYFLKGHYKHELNRDNPLGMKGEVAEAYGALLEKMWTGANQSSDASSSFGYGKGAVAPREFKFVISRFAPQFTGYSQHDSQELLAFLLDGLHEDLNRILKKPYVEIPDSNGRPDEVVAAEQWAAYRKRNDSVIVDLFQGQYKSKLICPECNRVSVTFDPFMYLTLPIPFKRMTKIKLTFVPLDTSKRPVKIDLSISKDSTIKMMKTEIAKTFGIEDVNKIFIAEVFQSAIYKFFDYSDKVGEILANDDIYAWELSVPDVPIPNRYTRTKATPPPFLPVVVQCADFERQKSDFGVPLVICIPSSPDVLFEDSNENEDSSKLTPKESFYRRRVWRAYILREIMRALKRYTTFDFGNVDFDHFGVNTQQAATSRTSAASPKPDAPSSSSDEDMTDAEIDSLSKEIETNLSSEPGSSTNPSETARSTSPSKDEKSLNDASASTADAEQTYPDPCAQIKYLPWLQIKVFEREKSTEWKFLGKTDVIRPGEVMKVCWHQDTRDIVFGGSGDEDDLGTYSWKDDPEEHQVTKGKEMWKLVDEYTPPETADDGESSKPLNIFTCLEEFVRPEQLGESDPWYCSNCQKHQQAEKKFDLWRLPDVLVVHLKRFSHNRTFRDKIDALVDFELEGLDLEKWVIGPKTEEDQNDLDGDVEMDGGNEFVMVDDDENKGPKKKSFVYDLYAVSNHFGGLGGGHYTAYAKNPIDNRWYDFDDSSVQPISESKVKSPAAYLLFYRRRGAKVPSIPTPSPEKLSELESEAEARIVPASPTASDIPFSLHLTTNPGTPKFGPVENPNESEKVPSLLDDLKELDSPSDPSLPALVDYPMSEENSSNASTEMKSNGWEKLNAPSPLSGAATGLNVESASDGESQESGAGGWNVKSPSWDWGS